MTVKRKSDFKDVHAPGTTPRTRPVRWRLNLVFLVLFSALAILGITRVFAYENGIARSSFSIRGTYTVPVLEVRPAGGETSLVAIVAHGFAGSKELMVSFGVELARAGITAYLFDFPGHGESTDAIPVSSYNGANGQINVIALSEVIDYVRTHNSVSRAPKIVLLGHSMGTAAVGDYSLAHADPDIIATILVSPVGQENPTATQPRNLLLLAGQNDLPYSLSDSTRLQRQGCGLSGSQPVPVQCGDPTRGSGRRAVVLPGLNHITILTASETFHEVLQWLQRTDPQQVNTGKMDFDQRLLWLLVAVVGILLAVFPFASLALMFSGVNVSASTVEGRNVFIAFACTIIGIGAAVAIQYYWQPFAFLHILLTDYVSGYFFFTALIISMLFFLIRRALPLPSFAQGGRQLLIALLLVALLYFTLGQLSTFAWQRFTLNIQRLWRVPIIFLMVWPIFLLDEGMSRGYQEIGILRALTTSILFKMLILIGLVVSIFLIPGLGFLSILLPILALLFVFFIALCTQIYRNGRAALTGATFCALFLAWIMATTFPITAG